MLRGVGNRLTDRMCEALDRRGCLGKRLENGDADGSSQRFADACDVIVDKSVSGHRQYSTTLLNTCQWRPSPNGWRDGSRRFRS